MRLDSGDLAYLSKQVRKILDENGCKDTKITVSNDLDEYTIQSLILEQKAPIDIFGVGTMLATSFDQPALGGVYKLKKTNSRDVIKISDHIIDLGPEGGDFGGSLIACGTPEEIAQMKQDKSLVFEKFIDVVNNDKKTEYTVRADNIEQGKMFDDSSDYSL